MLVFLSGLPNKTGGTTVNRWCGSSMEAIHMAAGKIAAGSGEVFICAGVESMTRIPMGGYNLLPNPDLYQNHPEAYMSMGLTAENLAKQYSIARTTQEEFAVNSHQKALKADLNDEIIPIQTKAGVVDKDGCVRADTSAEALAGLKPAFDANGTVTAGTSSPLTDGAAAVLVVSEEYARKNNLPVLARIKSMAIDGLAPEVMGLGPVHASKKALARAGIAQKDVDVVELNEAFAAQSLACIQEMGLDMAKVNLEGGAVALGHPLGASGARITGKAAKLLKQKGGKYALATMCIGGGQGIATVLEAL
jgi:acetyl-CoA acyltransferase